MLNEWQQKPKPRRQHSTHKKKDRMKQTMSKSKSKKGRKRRKNIMSQHQQRKKRQHARGIMWCRRKHVIFIPECVPGTYLQVLQKNVTKSTYVRAYRNTNVPTGFLADPGLPSTIMMLNVHQQYCFWSVLRDY